MGVAGERYAIYFPDGGQVMVDLSAAPGVPLAVKWLDVAGGQWCDGGKGEGGGAMTLSCPGAGHWVAVIKR